MNRVIIIGAGLAGMSAAISAAKKQVKSFLGSAQPSERAQSVLAQGGINAALGESDTVLRHCRDTLKGGAFLADPKAVAGLTAAAPEIIRWLSELGVPFNRAGGALDLRSFGGQSRRRTVYSKSSTGKMLMTAMIDETRKYEALGLVERLPHHSFVELNLAMGRCTGCVVRDVYSGERRGLDGGVILASGGLNGMFGANTSGTTQNTGGVTATVFRQGVALGNLEFIQYHPTTIPIQGKKCLISEAARAEGARLFVLKDGSPWYFMEELYPEAGNLMPRDVVSREMVKICARGDCGAQVYLDMTQLPALTWTNKLPEIKEECERYLHMNPKTEPIPVAPGIHYFMGGILVDAQHRTNIRRLYASGECACQYHGANRLGGNSLLGAVYGGITAAKSAIEDFNPHEQSAGGGVSDISLPENADDVLMEKLGAILLEGLGVIRSEQRISRAIEELERLSSESFVPKTSRDKILLGMAMLKSAAIRRESRGAHYREDYPSENALFRRATAALFNDGNIEITLRDIPQPGEERDENNNQNSAI